MSLLRDVLLKEVLQPAVEKAADALILPSRFSRIRTRGKFGFSEMRLGRGRGLAANGSWEDGAMSDAQEKIRIALMELMQIWPYDSIAVSAICDKAELSRKTFSRYFSSKDDVVVSQLSVDTTERVSTLLSIMNWGSIDHRSEILLESVYGRIYEHKSYYLEICRHFGSSWLAGRLFALASNLGDLPYKYNTISDGEMSFVINMFNGVNAIALKWWLDEGLETSPEKLAQMIVKWGYASLPEEPSHS